MGGPSPLRATSLGILIAALAFPAAAAAHGCTDLPVSTLRFNRIVAGDVVEHVATAEQIVRLSSTQDHPAPHPLMAMAYALDSQIRTVHRIVRQAQGYCDAPEMVTIAFGITRRDVFMTPQAAQAPCSRGAALPRRATCPYHGRGRP